jgi:hypothetical protein
MTFSVPEGFHALPVAASAEERARGAEQFVRELFPAGDNALWQPAAPFYAAVAEMMTEAGLAYSALGIFAVEEGVAHCSLSVCAVESGHTDPEVAAQGVRATLGNDPLNDVRWIDLPCGPAIACMSLREMTLGPDVSASGEDHVLRTGQIQVHIPFPTGPYLTVFTLDTAALDHWGEFCDMMVDILHSVSFDDPDDQPEAATAAPGDAD